MQREISSIDEYLDQYKESWIRTSCSIVSHGWTNGKTHTIINFPISCPQGTMFLISVDASDKVKDATLLFELLDEIIKGVGDRNVVWVIIDNASKYVLARNMIDSKYKTIFGTPYAAHCIVLILEDMFLFCIFEVEGVNT